MVLGKAKVAAGISIVDGIMEGTAAVLDDIAIEVLVETEVDIAAGEVGIAGEVVTALAVVGDVLVSTEGVSMHDVVVTALVLVEVVVVGISLP